MPWLRRLVTGLTHTHTHTHTGLGSFPDLCVCVRERSVVYKVGLGGVCVGLLMPPPPPIHCHSTKTIQKIAEGAKHILIQARLAR